ncbi:MAG: protein kinase [Pirellulales bacterium]
MALSASEFWELLTKSRLLTRDQSEALQRQIRERHRFDDGSDALPLAKRLIAAGALTPYQARVLLAGRAGPFFFGVYKVLSRCGRGRLASLYRACHVGSGYPVLLYFADPKREAPLELRAAIRQQARAAVRLSHDHLLRCYELDDYLPTLMVALEDLCGATLDEHLTDRRLAPAEAIHYARQLALGLSYLHERGHLHGAVRLENVWLRDDGTAALLHFPLSHPPGTTPGAGPASRPNPKGGPAVGDAFIAPELRESAAASRQGDIYALGCTMLAMLTGRTSLQQSEVTRGLPQSSDSDEGPADEPHLPEGLVEIVNRMTAAYSSERYDDAGKIYEALAEYDPVQLRAAADEAADATVDDHLGWPEYQRYLRRGDHHTRDITETLGEGVPAASPAARFAQGDEPEHPGGVAPNLAIPFDLSEESPPDDDETPQRAPLIATLATGIVGLAALVALFIYFRPEVTEISSAPRNQTGKPSPANAASDQFGSNQDNATPPAGQVLIPDDGRTFWASPTAGPPLDLAYLPAGADVVLSVRPAEILGQPEGERIFAAIGPDGQSALQSLQRTVPVELASIEQLIITWQATAGRTLTVGLVVSSAQRISPDAAAAWGSESEQQHGGRQYFTRDGRAYYWPSEHGGRLLAVMPAELIAEVIDAAGQAPPLAREAQQVLGRSDRTRHVNLLFAPRILITSSAEHLGSTWRAIRGPASDFFGEDMQAALFSAHLTEDDLFLELRVAGTLDAPSYELADRMRSRLRDVDEWIEARLLAAPPHRYGRNLVRRLPEMLRFLNRYTRVEIDHEQAALRSYLPARAAHNLLLAAELLLEPAPAVANQAESTISESPPTQPDWRKKLITVSFPRDTLENALAMVSDETGVSIVLQGMDLQLDGITRNQSFGLELTDRPAGEVLVELLRRANPDPSAAGPADPKQKLVYVVRPASDFQGEQIVVTTRAQAEKRGEALPEVFRPIDGISPDAESEESAVNKPPE